MAESLPDDPPNYRQISSVNSNAPPNFGYVPPNYGTVAPKFGNFTMTEIKSAQKAAQVIAEKVEIKRQNKRWRAMRTALGISGDALIPQIVGAANVFWVLFWVVCYAILSCVFLYQMVTLVGSFLDYKVDTQISIVRNTEATFPSITVCNSNPVRKSIISKVILGNFSTIKTVAVRHIDRLAGSVPGPRS